MNKSYALLIPLILFLLILPRITVLDLLILGGLAISNILILDKIERVLDDGH